LTLKEGYMHPLWPAKSRVKQGGWPCWRKRLRLDERTGEKTQQGSNEWSLHGLDPRNARQLVKGDRVTE
jgi:hypothetical protein